MTGSASALLRLGGVLAAGTVAAAAVAGCSGGGSSSSSAPASTSASSGTSASGGSSTGSSPNAVTGATPTTGSGTSGASGGTGTTAAACATQDLKVSAVNAEGAAGSTYTTLDFTNNGSAACTLYGYPGVSLATGTAASQVGAAAGRSTTASPTVVTLQPGQTGNALLRITEALNYPSAKCTPSDTSYLRIYPPNQTTSVLLAYKSTGCTQSSVKLLTIGVVQAGATSGQ